MTSSGTTNFSVTNGEAVVDAFERCGIAMASLEQKHFYSARRQLNLMLNSEWSNRGVNLWKVTLLSQALTAGTATYTLPSNVVFMLDTYISLDQGTSTQTDRILTQISRDDYASYPNKSTEAVPTSFWFNRQIVPQFTLWPVPDSNGPYTVNYYACSLIQDANLPSGETPDVPQRWYDAMCSGLAARLARIYAPTLEDKRKLDYQEAWQFAAAEDIENTPVRLVPNVGRYYR